MQKVEQYVDYLLAPSPNAVALVVMPVLGLGMGIIIVHWVDGIPPPRSSNRWWGHPR